MSTDPELERLRDALISSKQRWDDMYLQLNKAQDAERCAEDDCHAANRAYNHYENDKAYEDYRKNLT
jgi:hypothetical protein